MERRRNRFNEVELPCWIVKVKDLVLYDPEVKIWCCLPYPGHPCGCPNYGKKSSCPPEARKITDILNISKSIYMVFSEFDLESHAKRMKKKHPHWSKKMQRNVLYWQPRSRKQMFERAIIAMRMLGANKIVDMAEAYGVNFYATCFRSGMRLEKIKNLKICRHIALVGWRKKTRRKIVL